jgi:spermidine dehydrogenase
MDDIVLAPFDYEALDRAGENIRVRLGSTCVNVRDAGDAVLVGYVRDGAAYRVAAKHVVLACFHMIIPHLMPTLPQAQRAARSAVAEHQDAARLQQRTGA